MKVFKTILVIFVLGGLIITTVGCGAKSNGTVMNQVATVKRGNLTLDITAAGNLALADSEDLAVDLFYGTSGTKVTIREVLVQEGDYVKEGQVLVTIDKNEWDTQLAALEDQINNSQRAILQAQINEKNAEQAVKNSQETVTARETAVLNAEISYQQAQTALATSIGTVDTEAALAALRKAQTWYDYVTTVYKDLPTTKQEDYLLTLQEAENKLAVAQTNYDNAISGYDDQQIAVKKNQVQIAKNNLDAANAAVDDANNDVILKQMNLQLSQGNLQDAQKAFDDAQENLAEAQEMSPEIKAPFDGFITKVNVAGGDQVVNGAVAVTIADPNKFEADVLVSEMDITKVKADGAATVTADAISGIAFPAKVTQISPTATIQSGVVNYAVKVELDELNTVSQNQTTPSTENATAGNFQPPQDFMGNGPSGNFTMPGGFTPSGNMTFPQGTPPAFSSNQSRSQITSTTSSDIQLREGLTVTVYIVVDSRTNVLLVPNGAITTEGSQSYVQVVSTSGSSEKRAVKTGISNWEYTEITDGLSEGEQVEVALNTAPTATSTTQRQGGGIGIFRAVP